MRSTSMALLCGLSACLDLPDVQENVCGNGVVDTGEDCDAADPKAKCGQPGTERACLYVCDQDPTKELVCPPSFRCGVDGVCRKPATGWKHAGIVPEGAESLRIADFNGDGLGDVLAVASPRVNVHYFDANGALTRTSSVSALDAYPAVGNLTAAADESRRPRADFTINVSRGLDVIRGTAEGTLSPVAHDSASFRNSFRAARVTASKQPFGFELLLYNETGAFFFAPPEKTKQVATFAGGAGKLSGEIVAAPLLNSLLSLPCDEFVVAFEGQPEVWVYSLCDAFGNINENAAGTKIKLQNGKVCAGCQAVHAVDVDHDGDLDLVIGAEDDKLFIAHNRGDGHFQSRPDGDAGLVIDEAAEFVIEGGLLMFPNVAAHLHDVPLAVGDLNHDCVLDYVNDFGIYVSDGLPVFGDCPKGQLKTAKYVSLSEFESDHRWAEATIVDMNKDGDPDVFVGARDRTGITFFRGIGAGLFNPFHFATSGPVKDFTVGDFDGDLLQDLAFMELGAGDGASPESTTSSLSILFGGSGGKPEEPITMGEIAGLTQIVLTDLLGIYPDTANELFAFSTPGDGTTNASLFIGNGDRHLKAPYYPSQSPDQSQFEGLLQSTIGQFDGDASGHADIAVFSKSPTCEAEVCSSQLWLLPVTGDAVIAPAADGAASVATIELPAEVPDGVLIATWAGAPPLDAAVVVAPGEPPTLTIVSKASGTWEASAPAQLMNFKLSSLKEGDILVADVDGERGEDVVLSSRSGGVAVYLNNGDGTLDLSSPRRLSLDDFEAPAVLGEYCRADEKHRALSVGAVSLEPGSTRKTLVVTTRTASYLAKDDGAKLVLSCQADIPGGTAVAAGDINGDGVDDIAVGNKGSIEVLLGKVVSARDPEGQ